MDRGAFDAMDEEFFRRGEMLAEEEAEDFSDLDDVPAKPVLGLRLPSRPARSKRFLAVGTPPPERVADVGSRTAETRRRARLAWRWIGTRRTTIAIAAGVLLLAVLGWSIPGSEESAVVGDAAASPREQTATPTAAAAPLPERAPIAPAPAPEVVAPAPAPAVVAPAPAPAAVEPAPAPAPTHARAAQPHRAAKKTLSKGERRERAATAYAKGRKRYMAGDFDAAVRYFRATVKADPSYRKGYRALGLAYRKAGDRKRAVRAFRTYLRKSPRAKDRAYVERLLASLR